MFKIPQYFMIPGLHFAKGWRRLYAYFYPAEIIIVTRTGKRFKRINDTSYFFSTHSMRSPLAEPKDGFLSRGLPQSEPKEKTLWEKIKDWFIF